MILGLDIDGVVADFLSPFLQVVARKTGMGAIAAETITDFNFKEHPFLTEAIVWKSMEEVSYDPAFWRGLSSLISDEDWHRLEALSGQGKLVFVTHRYERETYSIPQVSCDWLRRHGISRPVVYFTQSAKSALVDKLGVKLFVDDRHENCQDVAENTEATVLMPHRSYNQSFEHPRVTRIQDLHALTTYLG